MKKYIVLMIIFLGFTIFYSCKPKKDVLPDLPCEQIANFKVYEQYQYQNVDSDRWLTTTMEEDTFAMGQGISDHRVFFEATQEGADKYEWWIGNETTPRVGKKISVLFLSTDIPIDITIPIKLKVTRQDRKDCNANGVYTSTRVITVLRPNKVLFAGRYVAYDDFGQPKIIEVTVEPDIYSNVAVIFKLKNLIGTGVCNTFISNTIEYSTAFSFAIITNDTFSSPAPYNCYATRGFGYLDSNNRNKLILQYTMQNTHNIPIIFDRQVKNIVAYRIP